MGAFSLPIDKMRLILAALVLIVAITSCQAQPSQGFAKAEVAAAVPAPVERLTPSERRGQEEDRTYGRRGRRYRGRSYRCGNSGGNNNGGNLSNPIEDLDNVVNLTNDLVGANGLLTNGPFGNLLAGLGRRK